MVGIEAKFEIKNDNIAEPKLYLGGNVEKFQLPNSNHAWSITFNSYVKGYIYAVKRFLSEDGSTLNIVKRNHKGPLPHRYKPELYTTGECDVDHTSRYQQLIRILGWAVEIGRIDIQLGVVLIFQY